MNGATFSPCQKYRYVLWRMWDLRKPTIMFIGLNPSTANDISDDPTIRRVVSMAKAWGYGGVYMLNCFPFISTKPDDLKDFGNNETNDHWLRWIADRSKDVVFAWGAFEIAKPRAVELAAMFPDAKALVINRDGSPRHPLYVPSNTKLVKYQS